LYFNQTVFLLKSDNSRLFALRSMTAIKTLVIDLNLIYHFI